MNDANAEHGSGDERNESGDNLSLNAVVNMVRGIIGALAGGMAGYFLFFWIAK